MGSSTREKIWAQASIGSQVVVSAPSSSSQQPPQPTLSIHLSLTHAAAGVRSDGDLPAAARRGLDLRAAARPPHPRQAEAAPRIQRAPTGSRGDRHRHQEAQPPRRPRKALLPAAVGQRRGRGPAGEGQHLQVHPPGQEGRLLHRRRPPRAQHQGPPPSRQELQAEEEERRRRARLDHTRLQKGPGHQDQGRIRAIPQDALFPAEGEQLDS